MMSGGGIGWGSALLVAGGTYLLVKLTRYISWVRSIEVVPGPERKLLLGCVRALLRHDILLCRHIPLLLMCCVLRGIFVSPYTPGAAL